MLVTTSQKNTHKILFQGDYFTQNDIKELENSLRDSSKIYDITLLDIKSIPLSVLEQLLQHKDRIMVNINQRRLWLYLSSFHIKSHLLTHRKFSDFEKKELQAVCIGGNINNLKKIQTLIQNIPYADIAIFIHLEVQSKAENISSDILQKQTSYKVYQVDNDMNIQKGHIYIIPSNKSFKVEEGSIRLVRDVSYSYTHASVERLFSSISHVYKEEAIVIITCDYIQEEAIYLEYIQKNNTEILIEDPKECETGNISQLNIKDNLYNRILSFEQIIQYLDMQLYSNLFLENEVDKFLEDLYSFYGYDFRHYERKSILRMISKTQSLLGINEFDKFKQLIMSNSSVLDELVGNFSINVTSFFRDPLVFNALYKIIKNNYFNHKSIRIWCAGCSSGQEAYSMAILMESLGLLEKTQIYATDFDPTVLNEAKNGIYPVSVLAQCKYNFEEVLLKQDFDKYFIVTSDYIKIKDFIKDKVLFFEHNLATDGSFHEFDIVLCRNVMIYFDSSLKEKVFTLIDNSIDDDGYLILGKIERLVTPHNYKLNQEHSNYKIFQKNSS